MRRAPQAFTLVELLVVIVIIGILVGMLMPVVHASREAARRTTCHNNLKQLALATQSFHENRGRMPTYWSQGDADEIEGGWLVHLLPFIEQQGAYDDIAAKRKMGYTRVMTQPASPDYAPAVYGDKIWVPGTGQTTQTTTNHNGHTYPHDPVTNNGYWKTGPLITPQVGTPAVYQNIYDGVVTHCGMLNPVFVCPSDTSLARATDLVNNGAAWSQPFSLTNYEANFTVWVRKLKKASPLECYPVQFDTITDGLSNTILFSECMRLCDGAYRMAFWNSYLPYGSQYYTHNFTVDWNGRTNTFMFQSVTRPEKCNNWRVQGLHNGTLSVAMADGSVHAIDPGVSRRETSDPDNPKVGVDAEMGDTDGTWDRLLQPADGGAVGTF